MTRNIVIYKTTRSKILIGKMLKVIGFNIFYYSKNLPITSFYEIKPPSSNKSTFIYSQIGHDIKSFFFKNNNEKNFILDYLAYSARSGGSLDFYGFVESCNNLLGKDNFLLLDHSFHFQIMKNKKRYGFVLKYFFYGLMALVFLFLNSLPRAIFNKKKLAHPTVCILRKKPTSDLGFTQSISKSLSDINIDSSICLSNFTSVENNYGFESPFNYSDSFLRLFRSFFDAINVFRNSLGIFSKFNIPIKVYKKFLYDTLLMQFISKIECRVFTGVLHDKPNHILLYEFLSKQQSLNSIYEAFLYYPFENFDYLNTSKYYAINKIEAKSLNIHGGDIKEVLLIGTRFNELKNEITRGISDNLFQLVKKYQKTILIPLVSIGTVGGINEYNFYDYSYLIKLLEKVYELCESHPEFLFIIKGKKNELSDINLNNSLSNLFIIDSKSPKLLKFNQFEDLLELSDLVISMNLGSRTIWQAIERSIPAISVNEIHPPSFLSQYKYTEVCLNELDDSLKYWLSDDPDKVNIIDQLRQILMIQKSSASAIVAEDIAKSIKI